MTNATTSLKLDDDIKARLQKLAVARRRTSHYLMREAITQFVEREERREELREAALKSWSDYRETGLHLTEAEVDAWLTRLEAGEMVPPPTPHK
jgi:predicted transcriptional regulator